MKDNLNLIVMLTHNDKTVKNAWKIFEKCKNSNAKYWGMKEEELPIDEMKKLYNCMKQNNKITVLEVVTYTEEEGLKGANIALECNVDILMGTLFYDSINELCKKHNIKYMPFVGNVSERPSILNGNVDDMVREANIEKGAYGIDLLGYRYTGDAVKLNKEIVEKVKGPVCIAGSINSYKRLDEIKDANPWAFTIGGAFFENKFEDTFSNQIDKVCNYIKEN